MNKTVIIIAGIFIFLSSIIILRRINQPKKEHAYRIGILQTASHPALDACREGFVEELTNKLGDTVSFITQNAQGSVAHAHALAQQLHADSSYTGFFAIATPAAQAIGSIEKIRPIIISAVTDPAALGLLHATTNICGTKDMIDVKAEIEMLTQLVPTAKIIGLLYTSGETNSTTLAQHMRKELEARGLTPVDFAMSSETDVQAMVELACRKCDVILAPTDNTVASTISAITAITAKYKKPLIVSDNMLVRFGALAARGVDYKASGKRAAQIAYMVLKEGKHPSELPIEQVPSAQIVINKSVLEALGLTIPSSLQKQVIFSE